MSTSTEPDRPGNSLAIDTSPKGVSQDQADDVAAKAALGGLSSLKAIASRACTPGITKAERAELFLLRCQQLERVFNDLPALGSTEYLEFIQTATAEELPPEVVVRAYRQLVEAGQQEAARLTRDRLFDPKHDYFRRIRYRAPRMVVTGQSAIEAHDLIAGAMVRVLELLPGHRGVAAETKWNTFIHRQLIDEWRKLHGRNGEDVTAYPKWSQHTSIGVEAQTAGSADPLSQELTAHEIPLCTNEDTSATARQIEGILQRVVDSFPIDSLERAVAENQFGPDRAPIHRDTRSAVPQTPLTDILGVDRYKISRSLKKVRILLAAALLAELDAEDCVRLAYLIRPVRPMTKRAK